MADVGTWGPECGEEIAQGLEWEVGWGRKRGNESGHVQESLVERILVLVQRSWALLGSFGTVGLGEKIEGSSVQQCVRRGPSFGSNFQCSSACVEIQNVGAEGTARRSEEWDLKEVAKCRRRGWKLGAAVVR